VLGFEWQVRTHARTDQAALQAVRDADRPEVPAPVTKRLQEGIRDIEHDLELNAKSKEEPRAQRRTNFWIAANDWP
jgi:hypothetical protein